MHSAYTLIWVSLRLSSVRWFHRRFLLAHLRLTQKERPFRFRNGLSSGSGRKNRYFKVFLSANCKKASAMIGWFDRLTHFLFLRCDFLRGKKREELLW